MTGKRALALALATMALAACAARAQPQGDQTEPAATAAAPYRVRHSALLDAAAAEHPVAFLDRIGWGADAAQLHTLSRIGATRLLEAQLHPKPDAGLPPGVQKALQDMTINQPLDTLVVPLVDEERALRQARRSGEAEDAAQIEARLKALNQRKNALTRQAMERQLLLAVYARDQLRQRLIWFWMNHFNVFRGGNVGPMMGAYVSQTIAPHALGHFRDLLQATMLSPQMLLYLNNAQNARGHINENYAREVMELHTLGLGAGYTQADVTNLARVLTGLGVDLRGQPVRVRPALRGEVWRRGLVVFNPARHDPDPKIVLGRTLAGHGMDEIEQVITLLADDPATARHISTELAQAFVTDHPPQTLVDAMAATWVQTHGDIASVLRTMFTSGAFAQSLAQPQFKDPMRYVLSAVRASLDGRLITHPQPLIGMLQRLGEPLYGRQTPDGYPLAGSAWDNPGQLTTRFEIARQIGFGAPALFMPPNDGGDMRKNEASDMTPTLAPSASSGFPRPGLAARHPPPDLARSPVFLAASAHLSAATREALGQADTRAAWNALWLSSPEFMND